MKLAVATGGFAGFALVSIAGFLARRDPASVFLEASVACVIGALLFRWFHVSFVRSVQAAHAARRQERAAHGASADKSHPAKS
jgi:hypothetical protein